MAVRIKFDNDHIPQTPTFVLANRNGNKLGVIPALHINVGDHLNEAMELQFTVQKEYNGIVCPIWDDIADFKLAWCPEWDQWYELHIEAKDGESVSKNITAVALGEAELSQINLYNIEINTETDIANDDYMVTVLYDENNPKASLLNRITEKAPHYTIGHVDSSIANIQRSFSFDGATILDALNDIAEEIDCLFVIDSGSDANGAPARTINAYDLEAACNNCGYRAVFTGDCPECGSADVSYGYGENTNIYVSSENLSDEITYTSNVDEVKNCFRLVGGDDLMTAAIASCNPNGSGYMWYFSDSIKEDMSDELQAKLAEYDEAYSDYVNGHEFTIPSALLSRYNALVNKYKTYRDTLKIVSNPITGYSKLMNVYYDTIDFEMLLRNELMPSVELSGKTAQTEAAKLTSDALSPTAVTNLEVCSLATASSAVHSVAKQLVDSNYQVKVNGISFNKPTWTGNFQVTNYSDDEDTATSATVSVEITDDQEVYLSQRINKVLADGNDKITDISTLFKADISTFNSEIKKYCLASLNSMRDICQSCLDILIENGIANGDAWEDTETNLYEQIYFPYYNKLNSLIAEVALREEELAIITGEVDEFGGVINDGIQTVIQGYNFNVQEQLDFEAYLGTELMKELAAYRREDTYQNDNFITDGLSNAEIISRALEFIELAKKEIYKSATLQHTITSSLKNLLVMREFSDLTEQFAVGNWLSVGVDGKVYRLRLTSYEIDFDDLENINVEFSDVVETMGGANDLESIIKSAASMSTSFGSVKRQANRGGKANKTLSEYLEKGLALTNMKIVTSVDNQNVIMDEHGLLMRELVPYNEDYDERQLKIINRGLYITKDGWRTSTAGIGDFIYYDPEDGLLKQDYGVIADVLMGNYILGEKVGIYNEGGTIRIDKNGLTIVSSPESEEDAGDQTVFKVQRAANGQTRDVIWFDNNGDAHFNGRLEVSSFIGDTTVSDLLEQIDGTITGVDIEYCQNQSQTVAPDEDDPGWQTTAPAWRDGYYIWQRTATTSPGGVSYSDPVCISGADGRSGLNQATVMLYMRAENEPSRPSQDLTYTFATATLSGNMGAWQQTIPGSNGNPCWVTAATATSTESTDVISGSEWSGVVKLVEDGETGENGLNQATIYLYRRAAATPNQPTGTSTYTFASGALSPIPSGWSREVPSGTDPCWVTTAVAISSEETDAIQANEWANVTKMVEDGDDGISPSVIREQYYLSTSSTTQTGGSWSYNQPSWTSGKYIWTRSEITWDDSPTHITYTEPQLATALTDVCRSVNESNKQEQLIYKSQAVGSTAPGKYYTWVTDVSGDQDKWTLKRPVYNKTKPVLYVATQSKTVGGTIDCTQPMIDDTTTVIDGGNIITGSVTANQLAANSITADKIAANAISADKIYGGILTIGGENDVSGRLRIKDANGTIVGAINHTGVKFGDMTNGESGFFISPSGDLGIGYILIGSDASSFYNNRCSFQVNMWGEVKSGSGVQLWYSPDRNTTNYVKKGTLKAENTYILLSKEGASQNTSIVIEDGGIKFYTDANNPGNYSSISGAGELTIGTPLAIECGGTGASTASGACANIGAVSKTGDTMSGSLWIRPSGARGYLGIISNNDYEADLAFGRNGSATWSISNRNSAEANLALHNNTRSEFVMRIYDADNHFKLYCPVTIEKSEGLTVVNPASPWPKVTFGDNNESSRGQIYYDCPIVIGGNGSLTNSKFMFREYSMNTFGAKLSYYEDYHLPNCDQNLSANVTYRILTTKNTLTVAQGGTGATTKAAARTNLEVYSKTEVDQKIADAGGGGSSITLPVSVSDGGTGRTTLTSGRVLVGNGTDSVSLRQITNNTSATAVSASTNLVTANTLYYHTGNSNITTVGTITSGTWNGTAIAASYIGNHSTDKLTSGTLGTSRGGTGITSNPSMLTNLGSTSAASVFATSPRPGVTGTLGTGNGGTGATSASGARTNLGVYSTSEVDTIASGKLSTSKILTKLVSGTTNANGNLDLGLSINRYYVLSVHGKDDAYIYQVMGFDDGNWNVHVTTNGATSSAKTNTALSVRVLYYDTQ